MKRILLALLLVTGVAQARSGPTIIGANAIEVGAFAGSRVMALPSALMGFGAAPSAGGVALGDTPTWTGGHTFSARSVFSAGATITDGQTIGGSTAFSLATFGAAQFKLQGGTSAILTLDNSAGVILGYGTVDVGGAISMDGSSVNLRAGTGDLVKIKENAVELAVFNQSLIAATGDETSVKITPTVNKLTSGNYTALEIDVTETAAPGAADLLLDLQVGDASKLRVDNAGNIYFGVAGAGLFAKTGGMPTNFIDLHGVASDIFHIGYLAADGNIKQIVSMSADSSTTEAFRFSASADLTQGDILSVGDNSVATYSKKFGVDYAGAEMNLPVAMTIDGGSTALPVGGIIEVTCTGAETWTPTETGAVNGKRHYIVNVGADALTMDYVAGQVILNGAADVVLGQNDAMTIYYSTAASAWIQVGATSNN